MDKEYGLDGTPPHVLRKCASELVPILAHIFCLSKNPDFPFHLEAGLGSANPKEKNHQHRFGSARSTDDLSYVTLPWSSSLWDFNENVDMAFDTSIAFDKVWHDSNLDNKYKNELDSPQLQTDIDKLMDWANGFHNQNLKGAKLPFDV
ncbi:uncharacterized protein [Panulirus ornatus]|uniref:uncharacterized protein n=1 Tax=Panulirus ornatus TaxID=150431 RepID=UPI003A8C4F4B